MRHSIGTYYRVWTERGRGEAVMRHSIGTYYRVWTGHSHMSYEQAVPMPDVDDTRPFNNHTIDLLDLIPYEMERGLSSDDRETLAIMSMGMLTTSERHREAMPWLHEWSTRAPRERLKGRLT